MLVWSSAKKTGPISTASNSPEAIPLNNGWTME
jgi:hypothetical protein